MEEQKLELETTAADDKLPELKFDDVPVLDVETVISNAEKTVATVPEETTLTAAEQKAVEEFSEKIDITNSSLVLQYGTGAQKHIANFSETALSKVRNKDMGEVGDMLSNLVVNLKGFDGSAKKSLFGGWKHSIEKMKANYSRVETNIDKITDMLEQHQVTLLKDIAVFSKMYEMNTDYYKELAMYIEAGKLRLKKAQEEELPKLQAKATQSGKPEDAQAASDFANMIDRFDKRLYDLQLTKTVSLQMGPQIRLLQNNDSLMAEKINSSIVNTIPLWKSQMVLALGLENSRQAIKAQKEVTDMTNELLKKNAELLKTGTIEAAKESERGIVDIETLKQTNQDLIYTIEEVVKIQQEGKQKRAEAEKELGNIEHELKQKLLEVSQGQISSPGNK